MKEMLEENPARFVTTLALAMPETVNQTDPLKGMSKRAFPRQRRTMLDGFDDAASARFSSLPSNAMPKFSEAEKRRFSSETDDAVSREKTRSNVSPTIVSDFDGATESTASMSGSLDRLTTCPPPMPCIERITASWRFRISSIILSIASNGL